MRLSIPQFSKDSKRSFRIGHKEDPAKITTKNKKQEQEK
jgi:hypothetical protein